MRCSESVRIERGKSPRHKRTSTFWQLLTASKRSTFIGSLPQAFLLPTGLARVSRPPNPAPANQTRGKARSAYSPTARQDGAQRHRGPKLDAGRAARIMQEIGQSDPERAQWVSIVARRPSRPTTASSCPLRCVFGTLAAGGTPLDACCGAVHGTIAGLFDDTSGADVIGFKRERSASSTVNDADHGRKGRTGFDGEHAFQNKTSSKMTAAEPRVRNQPKSGRGIKSGERKGFRSLNVPVILGT
jgi:hypothetical protein